jgi:hypothetical protein
MKDNRLLRTQHRLHEKKLLEIEADYKVIFDRIERLKVLDAELTEELFAKTKKMQATTLDLHDKMNEVFKQALGR